MRGRLALLVACLVSSGATSGCAERLETHSADFGALLRGEKNLSEVAASIAGKEFFPSAQIFVEHLESNHTRAGDMRANEKADPGYVFRLVTVRVVNNGTVDLSVATWQFSAIDERGSETNAITSVAHHDFDGTRIRPGGERWGTLVFEMRDDIEVVGVAWDGTITSTKGFVDNNTRTSPRPVHA